MAIATASGLAQQIERKAEQVRRLAAPGEAAELERLRDETAALQAMIAEAARLQLLERPSEMQGTAVFLPVLIISEEYAGYCLVTSLSPEGLKAKVYARFTRQQEVAIQFASHEFVRGTLVWTGHEQFAVRFGRTIDVAAVLAGLGGKNVGIGPSRPPRLPVRCLAEVSLGDRYQFTEVRDISQRGTRVLTGLAKPGQKVTVQIDELDERPATVQWSRGGSAGLSFAQPLSFHELALFGQYATAGATR